MVFSVEPKLTNVFYMETLQSFYKATILPEHPNIWSYKPIASSHTL